MASSFFVCQCWSLSSGSNLPGRWVTNCRNNGTSLESLDMAAPQLWKPSFRVGSNFCFQCWMLLCFRVEFGMQIHHVLQSIVKSSVCDMEWEKKHLQPNGTVTSCKRCDNGNGYYHWTQECWTHNTILGRIQYLFFIAVQFICVCFPSRLRETHRQQ